MGRSAYTAGGMHIEVKGRQVHRAEAPILVIAPHSTFLDAVIVYVTGFPSIIVRRESGMNPWFGSTFIFFIFFPFFNSLSTIHSFIDGIVSICRCSTIGDNGEVRSVLGS